MSRRVSRGVLVVGSIGFLINVVDAIGAGRLEPHDVFPAVVALAAGGGDLLKNRRPKAAKALYASMSVLLVVAGSVASVRAWSSLCIGHISVAMGIPQKAVVPEEGCSSAGEGIHPFGLWGPGPRVRRPPFGRTVEVAGLPPRTSRDRQLPGEAP
ncbi:hypothetical protein [Streptomyces collinus]|uniref:hypothetical protein n=1 Tax=Streptomyces collinus TaxID=42684 RepID=UPI00331B9A2A